MMSPIDLTEETLERVQNPALFFRSHMAEREKAFDRAADIQLPIMVQAAGEDRLVHTPAVEAFFAKLTMPDRTLKVYNDLYHEIYNETEPDRSKVIAALTAWLADRMTVN